MTTTKTKKMKKKMRTKEEEGRNEASSWTCVSRVKRLLRPRTKEKAVTWKAVAYLSEGVEEERRAWCQRTARSCHHHWQRRATVESGIPVTDPTKGFGSGGDEGDEGGGDPCHQTKRTRWTAGRWVMSVVTEMTKTVNCCCYCCKQTSEEEEVVANAAGSSGAAADEGGKTEKGRRSSGGQGRTKTGKRGKRKTGMRETKRGWDDWVTRLKQKRLTRWTKGERG